MKAVFLHAQEDLRVTNIDMPSIGADDVLVRVRYCGVCGSDMRMYFTGPSPRYINPVILGHEIYAEVTECGSDVQGYTPGEPVTVSPLIPCMRCLECSRGRDNLCEQAQVIGCTVHGGMTEYMLIPAQMVSAGGLVRLPADVDPYAGALTELVGCCLEGLDQTDLQTGERVLIIGDGPIGLTFLQLVRLMGVAFVATSGRRPRRRELARLLGADEAFDAGSVDLKARFGREFDLVIVAAPSVDAAVLALELIRPGGSLLLFSGYQYGTTLSIDPNAIHYRQLHIHGSIDCTVRSFQKAARFLKFLRMEKLVTAAFPLDRTAEAFLAGKEADAVKIVIEP